MPIRSLALRRTCRLGASGAGAHDEEVGDLLPPGITAPVAPPDDQRVGEREPPRRAPVPRLELEEGRALGRRAHVALGR